MRLGHRKKKCRHAVLLFLVFEIALGYELLSESFWTSTIKISDKGELGRAIATDLDGNLYVAGSYAKEVVDVEREPWEEFIGAPEAQSAVSTEHDENGVPPNATEGSRRLFLAKLAYRSHELEWLRNFGYTSDDFVTSIAFQNDMVFVAGATYGIAERNNSARHRSDLFAIAFTGMGDEVWDTPLHVGSGGRDAIETIGFEESQQSTGGAACLYMYIAGKVGGDVFDSASKAEQCSVVGCHTTDTPDHRLTDSSLLTTRPFMSSFEPEKNGTKTPQDSLYISNVFVAKVSPETGSILAGVQLQLDHENSGDAMTVSDGVIYLAVNSFSRELVGHRTSSLLAFCASDLSFYRINVDSHEGATKSEIQSLAADHQGNIFMSGRTDGRKAADTLLHFVQKIKPSTGSVFWHKSFGVRGPTASRSAVHIGQETGNVFLSGFFEEAFSSDDDMKYLFNEETYAPMSEQDFEIPKHVKARSPFASSIAIVSPRNGTILLSWKLPCRIRDDMETVQRATLDNTENLVTIGDVSSGSSGRVHINIGTFGTKEISSRLHQRSNEEEETTDEQIVVSRAIGSETSVGRTVLTSILFTVTFVLCLLAALMLCFTIRSKLMSRRLVSHALDGFNYEDDFFDQLKLGEDSSDVTGMALAYKDEDMMVSRRDSQSLRRSRSCEPLTRLSDIQSVHPGGSSIPM